MGFLPTEAFYLVVFAAAAAALALTFLGIGAADAVLAASLRTDKVENYSSRNRDKQSGYYNVLPHGLSPPAYFRFFIFSYKKDNVGYHRKNRD